MRDHTPVSWPLRVTAVSLRRFWLLAGFFAGLVHVRRSLESPRSTQQFNITLPNEMADAVKTKVADGEYDTESEVVREGLHLLCARDRAVEQWPRREVASAYDGLKADPTRSLTSKQLRASLSKHALNGVSR
jgi:putative addiction module CopG family antidote